MDESGQMLDELMRFVSKRHPYDDSSFPNFRFYSGPEQAGFALGDTAHLLTKALSSFAEQAVIVSRGGCVDDRVVEVAIAEILVRTLALAASRGLTGERLAALVREEAVANR